ncbi:MAG: BspA family leucine-rich repeat surface protein, partial [Bacteroidota bacterium]
GATNFNQDIGDWEVGNVENLAYTFFQASSFNQDIGGWNIEKITRLDHTLDGAQAFNQDIGNWEVSQVENFGSALASTTHFDQDLSHWNVGQATKMSNMFHHSGLSTENYDRLLLAWAQLDLQDSVRFDAGYSIYCEGWEARAQIINQFAWTIEDDGADDQAPTAICQDITIQLADTKKIILPSELDNGSYGHCSAVVLAATKTEFTCEDIGHYTNTLTVTDQLGNLSTCTSTITIVDGPVQLTCPSDKTVLPNRPDCQSIVYWDELYGNCSTEVTSTHRSGSLFPTGTTPVTYTATNHLQDTMICRFNITVASDLSYEANVVEANCFRSADGAILLEAQGGAGNYRYDWDIDGIGDQDDPAHLEGLDGGTYQIILSDDLGCSISAQFELTLPTAIALQSSIEESLDGVELDLSVMGGQPGYQYDWNHDGTGDFDDPQDLEVTTGGTYTVMVRDENGCEATHTREVILSNISNPFTLLYFDVFPNPNQGVFDLRLANPSGVSSIAIFNLQGKKVDQQTIRGQQAQLDVRELPAGTYWLRVNNSMGNLVKSFVINQPTR